MIKENSHIFYAPQAHDSQPGQQVYLDEDESFHCCKVLRQSPGDIITIADGNGKMYNAQLNICNKNECLVTIKDTIHNANARKYRNHIAIAPTKNIDRLEWFVEKAVEFGIDEITPLLCDHSERKILKIDRLKKIAISAMKQSGNLIVPEIHELTPFKKFVSECTCNIKLIAHCEPQEKVYFGKNVQKNQHSCTLIGPEGDFSDNEIQLALSKGFVATSLGNTRLRTETAGISVCAFLAMINME